MLVPWYLWGESLTVGYFVPGLMRYALVLNATWLVNSAAHMWGNRPYDQGINPRENRFVAFSAVGKEPKGCFHGFTVEWTRLCVHIVHCRRNPTMDFHFLGLLYFFCFKKWTIFVLACLFEFLLA